jgi:hypothetical protein
MLKVVHHIIEAYLIHRQLIEKDEQKKRDAPNVTYYKTILHQPPTTTPNALKLQGSINNFKGFLHKRPASVDVWTFLQQLSVQKPASSTYACTWLELYIMYRLCGHCKPIPDRPHKARRRATVGMQLREFKNTVRGVADRAFYDQESKDMFKPIKIQHERFLHLAIRGKMPAINLALDLDEGRIRTIEDKLIMLGHKISGTKLRQYTSGSLGLASKPLMLNGRVGWDSKLDKSTTTNVGEMSNSNNPIAQHDTMNNKCGNHKSTPEVICLACPGCKACITSNNPVIQLVDLDRSIKCEPCGKHIRAKDWNCKCLIPWHLCSVHRHSHSKCSTKNLSLSVPSQGSKRIPTMSLEDLRALDNKRARRGPPAILPPQTNILSPGLRVKFAHLLNR